MIVNKTLSQTKKGSPRAAFFCFNRYSLTKTWEIHLNRSCTEWLSLYEVNRLVYAVCFLPAINVVTQPINMPIRTAATTQTRILRAGMMR